MNEAMKQALAESAAPGDGEQAGFAPDGFPVVVCGVDTDVLNRTGLVNCGSCHRPAAFQAHGALCNTCVHYCGLEVPTAAVELMLENNATMREIIAEQAESGHRNDTSDLVP